MGIQGRARNTTVAFSTILVFLILSIAGRYYFQQWMGGSAAGYRTSIAILLIASFIASVVYAALSHVYLRHYNSRLVDGSYTDNSWLSIQRKQIVLLDEDSIATVRLNTDQIESAVRAFKNNASNKNLTYLVQPSQISRIRLDNITAISSAHDKDIIWVNAGENKQIELKFVNNGTKMHALGKLAALIPASLQRTITQQSRIESAGKRLEVLKFLGLVGVVVHLLEFIYIYNFYFFSSAVWSIVALISITLVIPKLGCRLLNPTILTEFKEAH